MKVFRNLCIRGKSLVRGHFRSNCSVIQITDNILLTDEFRAYIQPSIRINAYVCTWLSYHSLADVKLSLSHCSITFGNTASTSLGARQIYDESDCFIAAHDFFDGNIVSSRKCAFRSRAAQV